MTRPGELFQDSFAEGLGMTGRWRQLVALAGLGERLALLAILALSAALNLVGLDREGYGNTYYAAAVKSMLTSWRTSSSPRSTPAASSRWTSRRWGCGSRRSARSCSASAG